MRGNALKNGIRVNEAKSVRVIFITRRETCPPVILNGLRIPQAEDARYLRLHLDGRLNWRKHIFTKRKQLGTEQDVLAARQRVAAVDRT